MELKLENASARPHVCTSLVDKHNLQFILTQQNPMFIGIRGWLRRFDAFSVRYALMHASKYRRLWLRNPRSFYKSVVTMYDAFHNNISTSELCLSIGKLSVASENNVAVGNHRLRTLLARAIKISVPICEVVN